MNILKQSKMLVSSNSGGHAKNGVILSMLLLAAVVMVPPPGNADQSDERLQGLFERLKTAPDPMEAKRIEAAIWRIWLDSGQEEMNVVMEQGIQAMGMGRLAEAIAVFDRVVSALPDFAEGWNKRATVHYLNGNYTASVADIERTLALEPRHFGAISGMGLIFMARGDEAGALRAFEAVLEIHPHAQAAQIHVEALRMKLMSQGA